MSDVIVVGAGIIGLTAAVRLREAGATVRVWAAHEPAAIVSSVAAAVWYPTHTDYAPHLLTWATAAYAEFTRQAADGIPGVLLRPTRNLVPGAGTPWWAPAAGAVSVRPGEVSFQAPLVEMGTYLPWLADRAGGVELHPVDSLAEALAEAPVVVNATGLAAGRLCGDPAVYPARGQIVLVANPGLSVSVRREGDRPAYVHPRRDDVVLGGTFDENVWDTEPDPATTATILSRCRELVPELAGATVLGEKVGLRPCRLGGPRVAAEPSGGGLVVHAYGHGGAGMTLSWGCADEVTRLVLARLRP